MKNFKTLLIHESLQQIKSFKFFLMLALSLIVAIFTAYLNVADFNERYKNYDEEKINAQNESKNAGTFAELQVPIILQPNPLSVFSKGFEEKAGNKINISVEKLPELEAISQKKNQFMSLFLNFDIISIVKIILSLTAIFLIADSISGEREDETLKMIFLNRVSRLEFFFVKFSAALIAVSIPLLVMFLFPSIYLFLQPSVQLSGIFWIKLFLIFLSSLGFLTIFILLGLWISIKASSSAQAMIFGLFMWILIIFIYPNMVDFTISKLVNVPSSEEQEANIDKIYDEFGNKLIKDYEKNYPKGKRYFTSNVLSSIGFSNKNGEWISLPYKEGISSKFYLEFETQQVERMIPVLLTSQDRMMDIYDEYRNNSLKQKRIDSWMQTFMPGYLLEEASKTLAGTSYELRVLNELKKARQYRSSFINFIKSKDGFGPKYFTQIPQNLWSDSLNDYRSISDQYDINNYPKLNLLDIPEYPSLNIFKIPLELFFIVVVNLILFLIVSHSFLSFNILNK